MTHFNFVKTSLKHQCVGYGMPPERGSRYWTTVELISPAWFVVEVDDGTPNHAESRRWLTPSVWDAVHLRRNGTHKGRIWAFIPAPEPNAGFAVGELEEIYRSGAREAYSMRLSDGLTYTTGDVSSTQEMILIYSSRAV